MKIISSTPYLIYMTINVIQKKSIQRTLLDLSNQFETILILDTTEGTLDFISLIILACGCFIPYNDISKDIAICSEGIHI